ncbi:hypothetical protein WJX74_010548 [Apatococcus lobatus]|uniref:AMP-dependent synthetase/ligase domain-containing protein n=1 Tax=Apatococcus lobatus TaxID=904363 RepID=A0AAW1RQE3_9CHLO
MANQKSLYDLMSSLSAKAPDMQGGGLSSAHGQVDIRSAQIVKLAATLAEYLSSTCGMKPADTLTIVSSNSPEMAVVFLASTFCRAIAAPISKSVREEGYSAALSEAGTKLLILLSKENQCFAVTAAEKLGSPTLVVQVDKELHLTCCHQEGPEATLSERTTLHDPPQPNDVAHLLHTSGTTSRPKGVPLRHKNLAAGIDNVVNTYALGPRPGPK